jgi:hypothetical protein
MRRSDIARRNLPEMWLLIAGSLIRDGESTPSYLRG